MKLVMVYNPQSGTALGKRELRKVADEAGFTIEKFIKIKKGFEKKLAPYIAKGSHIAACGGDGTISAVAACVASTKAVLVPLPGGTLNHFTKDLGVDQDVKTALMSLKDSRVQRVDIASVGGISFINNSSIGLYPTSLHERKEIEPRGTGKWLAAVVASLRALLSFKTHTVTIDDRVLVTPFVFVGNNRYEFESVGVINRDRLDEGVLTIYIAKTQSRFVLLKVALLALVGKMKSLTELEIFHAQHITIETRKMRLSVSYDGEVSRMTTPLEYKIHPRALNVLVSRD